MYQSRPHNTLSTAGKPFWGKVLIVFTNMITLWECRSCRQRLPHHPTKGHRMSEKRKDMCRSCCDMEDLMKEHTRRMDNIRKGVGTC